jgi:hypothetical protein
MPSIAVDGQGGINIIFLRTAQPDNTDPPSVRVTVRYARWPSFASLAAFQRPFLADLSDPFRPWTGSFNDFQMICAAGCSDVYAGWASSQSGTWDLYVSHIDVGPCTAIADFDQNGSVDVADAAGFLAAFSASAPAADVNRDAAVNGSDFTAFMDDYACGGCTPHP